MQFYNISCTMISVIAQCLICPGYKGYNIYNNSYGNVMNFIIARLAIFGDHAAQSDVDDKT